MIDASNVFKAFSTAAERNDWYAAMTQRARPVTYVKSLPSRVSKTTLDSDDAWLVVDDVPENWIPSSVVVTPLFITVFQENHISNAFRYST